MTGLRGSHLEAGQRVHLWLHSSRGEITPREPQRSKRKCAFSRHLPGRALEFTRGKLILRRQLPLSLFRVPGGRGFWLSSEGCTNGGLGFRGVINMPVVTSRVHLMGAMERAPHLGPGGKRAAGRK